MRRLTLASRFATIGFRPESPAVGHGAQSGESHPVSKRLELTVGVPIPGTGLVPLRPEGRCPRTGCMLWRFRCFCGQEAVATAHSLARGVRRSCGCLWTKGVYPRERYEEVLRLRCEEGLTYRQIGQALGRTHQRAHQVVQQARVWKRKQLRGARARRRPK